MLLLFLTPLCCAFWRFIRFVVAVVVVVLFVFLFLQWVTTVFLITPRGAGIATGSRPGQERRENFILQC